MDWDLKTSTWDETTLPNIETMEEESNRFGVYSMKGEFSVDLKLGHNTHTHHLTNSYSVTDQSSSLPMSKHAASSSSVSKMAPPSSKKARAINNTTTIKVSCLVDGCNSDLSNCRDYHRRHKVCELHSKTPEVTISGLKQRFCQQCSRFHSLEQFDERKRSCRKRLDGHNRRRRKPQGEPLMRPAASFLSNYQGTQLLPFSPSTAMVNPVWNGGVVNSSASSRLQHQHNQQVHHLIDKQDIFLGSTATSYVGEGKQLAFLQNDNPSTATMNNQTPHLPITTTSVCQTLLRTSPLSENCGVRNKMLLTTSSNSVQESPCALSLLSSSQTHTSSGNGLNQMVQQPHSLSTLMQQPLGLSLHGNRFESLVPNGSESDHCSSLYNMGSEGSHQGSEAPQLFPYHHQWE